MLPKNKRLDKKTFQSIISEKRVISTRLFLFFLRDNEAPRYAFVAPKNVFKTAVKRNKYRRIGYNILRSLNIKAGSGVFFYKREVLNVEKEKIKDDIIFILKRAKFYNNVKNN